MSRKAAGLRLDPAPRNSDAPARPACLARPCGPEGHRVAIGSAATQPGRAGVGSPTLPAPRAGRNLKLYFFDRASFISLTMRAAWLFSESLWKMPTTGL